MIRIIEGFFYALIITLAFYALSSCGTPEFKAERLPQTDTRESLARLQDGLNLTAKMQLENRTRAAGCIDHATGLNAITATLKESAQTLKLVTGERDRAIASYEQCSESIHSYRDDAETWRAIKFKVQVAGFVMLFLIVAAIALGIAIKVYSFNPLRWLWDTVRM